MFSRDLIGCIIGCVLLSGFYGQAIVKNGSQSKNASKTPTKYLLCSKVSDLPFANCHTLKLKNKCKPKKMEYYCPIACNFCKGVKGETKALAPPAPKCKSSLFGCCEDDKTEAQGNDFAGCPEKCFDAPGYPCKHYTNPKHNFCDVYKEQLLTRCPLSCKRCTPPEVPKPTTKPACFNVWRDQMCDEFAKNHLCYSPKFEQRMGVKCRKSCKKCEQDIPLVTSVVAECVVTGKCCWDKSVPVNGNCPVCKNHLHEGFCKRFESDCQAHDAVKSVQIRLYCPKTCGFCDTKTCRDDLIYGGLCPKWKERGDCDNYPTIMQIYCKKTCGFCS